jgi:hypothetical protein
LPDFLENIGFVRGGHASAPLKTRVEVAKLFPPAGKFFPSGDGFGTIQKCKRFVSNTLYSGTQLVLNRSNSSYKITLQIKILPYNKLTAINS